MSDGADDSILDSPYETTEYEGMSVNLEPPQTMVMIYLNPSTQVDADWSQSWNPAVGKPKKFIDINCLTRLPDVMQYFCFTDNRTPEQLDMDWLIRFVMERYPYDLISGAIFHDQSQAFEYKMRSFSNDFFPLETLSSEYHETFRQTLFISWGILMHLFEGQPISSLYSNVRNRHEGGELQFIFRIQRRTLGNHSATASVIQSNSSFSGVNRGGDGSNDGDSDSYNGQGQPGRPQQQRGGNGGSDRRPSKRGRGENDGADGSSSEVDSDSDEEDEEEHDFGEARMTGRRNQVVRAIATRRRALSTCNSAP